MAQAMKKELDGLLDAAQRAESLLVYDDAMGKAVRARLDRLVEKHELIRPVPSSYARRGYWEGLTPALKQTHIIRACAERHPDWVFCGVSAAAWLGYDPTWELLKHVHVADERGRRRYSTSIVKAHEIKNLEVERHNGVLVTTPERTLFDCLCTVPFVDGLAMADRSTRVSGWRDDHVISLVERYASKGRYRGLSRALETAAYVDGRAESGGESIARANMIQLGFERPELQVDIEDLFEPGRMYRVDFAWLVEGIGLVVGELDGGRKYCDKVIVGNRGIEEVLLRERQRESRLSAVGARIARFNYAQARNPDVLARLLKGFGVPQGKVWSGAGPSLRGYERLGNVRYCADDDYSVFTCSYRRLHSKSRASEHT